jgi:hypothetical protein
MLAGGSACVYTEGDGPRIGATFSLLVARRVRLSQIKTHGEVHLAMQLEPLPAA